MNDDNANALLAFMLATGVITLGLLAYMVGSALNQPSLPDKAEWSTVLQDQVATAKRLDVIERKIERILELETERAFRRIEATP